MQLFNKPLRRFIGSAGLGVLLLLAGACSAKPSSPQTAASDPNNAASLYLKFVRLHEKHRQELAKHPRPMGGFFYFFDDEPTWRYFYTSDQITAVRKDMRRYGDAMATLHAAIQKPYCTFDIGLLQKSRHYKVYDYDSNKVYDFNDYEVTTLDLRAGARLLGTETFLLAYDGKYSQAVANAAVDFQMAKHMVGQNALSFRGVGWEADGCALRSLDNILHRSGLNTGVYDMVASLLKNDYMPARMGTIDPHSAYAADLGYFDTEQLAFRNVLCAAAEVMRVKAARGAYPDALPGDFQDPFSGHALLYKKTKHGFAVQTVDPSLKYKALSPGGSLRAVVFEYPGPKPIPVPRN